MSEYPLPPGYDGDYSRPLDPQFVDPQHGWQPRSPFLPTPPPPRPPRQGPNRNAIALGALGGLVAVLALVLALMSLTSADQSSSRSIAPVPAPSITSQPTAGLQPAAAATIVGVQYFFALSAKDPDELQNLGCPGTALGTNTDLARIAAATPSGAATVVGAGATMTGSVLLDDGSGYDLALTLRQRTPTWCILAVRKQ